MDLKSKKVSAKMAEAKAGNFSELGLVGPDSEKLTLAKAIFTDNSSEGGGIRGGNQPFPPLQETLPFSQLSDQEVRNLLKQYKIGLTVEEARKVEVLLKRPPTVTEAVLWGIQGSEHCSYKSSRPFLKSLPTKGPNVVLGVGEDSGIVEIAKVKGDRYGIVVSHESHNHPSQIVPFEGAATGVGGCVRDVACMGARVIGAMDPLRFGQVDQNQQRQIANGVVSGIAGYGNPLGIPNLGGDVYFDQNYNDNCLVNVVTLGIIRESHIIHSFVPKQAAKEQWDIIVIGKATDYSGMGGAAFASVIMEEEEKEKNKGSVQEPNPFLKRHILVSSYDLFKILQERNLLEKVSFKDMGAGGITCATVEQVAKAGLGATIDLDKVHVAFNDMPPSVIACSETQERFAWMCHPSLTQLILDHYNQKWDLPLVAENARASLVGKVTTGNFILTHRGEKVVDAKSADITEGLLYNRPYHEPKTKFKEPNLKPPKDLNKILLQLLESENIACRKPIYEHYDKQVQGFVIIEAGMADASVLAPLLDESTSIVDAKTRKVGAAFSTDSTPRYALISPYYGAAAAVVESMRNVAAVGAAPQAITDCLNYGNPEKPEQMWELVEGIRGIKDACHGIPLKSDQKSPTPVISGNVSLYNESKNGHVPPSAIICCVGKIDDYTKAIKQDFKKAGHKIYLLGKRKNELGGSEYYRLFGELGANVPKVDFEEARKEIYTMVDGVKGGLIESAHDISEGGMAVTIAEMAFGAWGNKKIGASVDLKKVPDQTLTPVQKLFGETGGFICEISPKNEKKFLAVCKKNKLTAYCIGATTTKSNLIFKNSQTKIIDLQLSKAADRWLNGLRKKL